MKLKLLFIKREEIMQRSFSFPVGSLDWEKCQYELDVVEACMDAEFDPENPDHILVFKEHVEIESLIEEVFGVKSDKWSA